MRSTIHSFRRAAFAAAVAGALLFGAGQAFARTAATDCSHADGVCYSLPSCDYYCESIGSPGGGCYQGCCFCA